MKKTFTFILSFLTALVLISSTSIKGDLTKAESDQALTIAISDFQTRGAATDQQWIGPSCVEAITAKITGQKNVKIVERQYLSKIIEEQKLQASGLVEETSAVELGNLVAVKYFIFGSATVSGNNLMLRAKIVDVATSVVKATAEVSGTLNDIFKLQNDLTQKIAGSISLGNIVFTQHDAGNTSNMTFSVANKLEKIKKMADPLPFFMLDPARKRKTTDYTLAINMCDDLIEKYPGLQKAHFYKALFSIHAEDYATADVESKEAKSLNADDVDALLLRSFYFLNAEKITEAKQALTYSSTKFPNDSRVWYALSKINLSENNNLAATENLINCLNNAPYLSIAESNLRSLVTSNQFLENQFSNSTYYNIAMLYRVMYGSGGPLNSKIYAIAQQTSQTAPNFSVPFYMMGLFESKQGNKASAEKNYFNAIRLKPTFAEAHRELGLLYLGGAKCYTGKQHITLYLQSSNSIDDYSEIQNKINKCK